MSWLSHRHIRPSYLQRNLESLGDSIEDMTAAKQGEKLLKILSKFSTGLNDFVDGKGLISESNRNIIIRF